MFIPNLSENTGAGYGFSLFALILHALVVLLVLDVLIILAALVVLLVFVAFAILTVAHNFTSRFSFNNSFPKVKRNMLRQNNIIGIDGYMYASVRLTGHIAC